MLPDFPVLKDALQNKLMDATRLRRQHYMGLLGRIGVRQLHEGKGQLLVRADGSIKEVSPVKIAVPITLAADEVES